MKRWPLVLLTLFFLVLAFLYSPSASAQSQPKITTDQPFYAWVIFAEETVGCGGSLYLSSPFERHIFDYSAGHEVVVEKIGPFAAGTELTFSLTPKHPCSTETLFSENPNHVYIEEAPQGNLWGLVWMINQQTDVVVTVVGLQELSLPSHRPVIFIHGLGGRPEDWTTGDKRVYFDTLKANPYNYPEDYLATYAYADADGTPAYDYQGDITKISDDLGGYVDELSARHLLDGGDGKVDIVGFSLGGLVARQYLNENPDDHRVRKLITIASPHRGAWILNPENWVELIPGAGEFMRKALASIATTFLQILGQDVDLNSPAAQQARTGSNYLSSLNNISVESLHYDAVYGDIDAEIRQKVFFFELKRKLTIGDGYIMPESATGIPASNLDTHGFSDETRLELDLHVQKGNDGGYKLAVDPFSLNELNYHHGKLITHPDVVSRVVNLLTAEE